MSTPQPGPWCCRASYFTARVFCLALGMSAAVGGFIVYVAAGNGAAGHGAAYWLPGSVLVGLAMTIWVGPWLLQFAERRGWFGQIRVCDNRVEGGGRSWTIDLNERMQVEARFQRSTIQREYRMRDLPIRMTGRPATFGSRRGSITISVMTLAVEQSGRRLEIVADETSMRPGRDYDAEGLMIRRVAISPLRRRPKARLWPADLAELLQLLQRADGYQAVTTPVPDKPTEDPRRVIYSTWRLVAGLAAVLVVAFAVAAAAFLHYQDHRDLHTSDVETPAESK